jgi:capsular exopolysaccharide synthesis family protein
MSNIFDAVLKSNVISLDELPEIKTRSFAGASTDPYSRDSLAAPGLFPRQVGLKVSIASPVFPFDQTQNEAAEQYRIIRTKILNDARRPQLIVFSSAESGDGKTVTSINVAASLALKQDVSVVLVDGDLRRPSVADMLGLSEQPGLSDVLEGRSTLNDVILRTEELPNLSIIPAGSVMADPAELLDSAAWRSVIMQLRQQYQYIILDATPAVGVADYELLQQVCDGVVVVARPDHTPREAVLTILQTIPKSKLIGVVLNCVEDWWLWKTPAYGYYKQNSKPRRKSG